MRMYSYIRYKIRNAMQCTWPQNDEQMLAYHDTEWGTPAHDDKKHFEFLVLEGAQAGLSWSTILNKRAAYRKAFVGFDPQRVARFGAKDVARLLADEGIVRNRLKIGAAIGNAQRFLDLQDEAGSFDAWVWRYVGGQPMDGKRNAMSAVPATTPESDLLSRDLKRRGFRFVGSTIMYAFMQATGMVNDHLVTCDAYAGAARRPRR